MIFFTDITTNISKYCLLNIKKLNDKRRINKNLFFIDPGVYELTKSNEYSKIDELHKLANNLKDNEFISIDYPCDMNKKYTREFIHKSIKNNIKYADNLQYICTIQMKFRSYSSFVHMAEKLRYIWEKPNKIIGIGNMCRIMYPDNYTDNVFGWIRKNMIGKWVHVYGMPLRLIKKYAKALERNEILLSVDSTKWTRRIHKKPPLDKSICCRKNNRDLYFIEYIKELQKKGIHVVY